MSGANSTPLGRMNPAIGAGKKPAPTGASLLKPSYMSPVGASANAALSAAASAAAAAAAAVSAQINHSQLSGKRENDEKSLTAGGCGVRFGWVRTGKSMQI